MENGTNMLREPAGSEPKPKREYTRAERLLLPCALLIGILLDRLFYAGLQYEKLPLFWGIFWLSYLAVFTVFYWKRVRSNKLLWFITICSALLCVWGIFYGNSNQDYAAVTFLVVPAVLMAHAVFSSGEYTLKDAGSITVAWFSGWFIKPFSALPIFFGTIGSIVSGGRRSAVSKAALGIGITLLLLCVIVPLLSGADQVFRYYLESIAADWDLTSFVTHIVVIIVAFALFYSFMWNVGFGKREKITAPQSLSIDVIICGIVLGSVTLLYLLFCGIQFTYLFAGAGLPGGMTYSEYAREGFAQTVTVCAINLAIYGVFLRFGARGKLFNWLLGGLLALTGVMLVSGCIRLGLYIDVYGLTWLRLISGWFVVYLAAVIVLCAVRLRKEKLPVIALCALLLLAWYVVLGYANPDALITLYNKSYGLLQ